jgi:membrane protease YdiL (CAAX protease family)
MNTKLKTPKWWQTLARVLLFCISCAVILAVISRLTQGLLKPWSILILGLVSSLGAFILTILFVRWEGLLLKDVGVVPVKSSLVRALTGFVIGLFLAILQPLLVLLTGHIRFVKSSNVTLASVLITLLIYFILASREELAFRGYPLRSLNNVLGSWTAQLLVASLFVAEHILGGMTLFQALWGVGVGSIFFGIAALTTKGLAVPIGLHAAWNFGQWAMGLKDESGLLKVIVEKGYEKHIEQVGMISYLIVMFLGILVFYYYGRKNSNTYA